MLLRETSSRSHTARFWSALVIALAPSAVAAQESELVQDLSWYPFDEPLPFVGAHVSGDDVRSVIHAGGAVLSVNHPPRMPAGLSKPTASDASFEPGYFLVHFQRSILPEDKLLLDALTGPVRRADGSALARWYVPNDTLVAWVATPRLLETLQSLAQVDWVGRYQPGYKLGRKIGLAPVKSPHRVGRATWQLDIDLIPGHPFEPVEDAVRALGAVVLQRVDIRGRNDYDVRFLVVQALAHQVIPLSWIEGVRLIQESGDGPDLGASDLSASGKVQGRTLSVDDGSAAPMVTAADYPLWLVHDLQGQGQIIGFVDTSFDWNNTDSPVACATGFPDTAIDSWGMADPDLSTILFPTVGAGGVSLKVPLAVELGGAVVSGHPFDHHGINVTGVAIADFYGDEDQQWWEHDVDSWSPWAPQDRTGVTGDGIAHEAQMFAVPTYNDQNAFIWDSPGEFPLNLASALDSMVAAGVCIVNQSFGVDQPLNTYTTDTLVYDTKAYDYPNLLQCANAGNLGAGADKLNPRGCAKNVLTVGASDDVLLPESRASFSSTGPRFDTALKPEVMAVGTDLFVRSSGMQSKLLILGPNGPSTASCTWMSGQGTSYATPLVSGCAALIHQYFEEGRYPGTATITDPSGALMKAMLVNSGHRLTGSQLGDGTYPNDYQGWGEVDLMDVLDFGTGSRRLIVEDVDSASGFSSPAATPHTLAFLVNGSSERLRVTLVWTDEPGTVGTGKQLVNDLDLLVTGPAGGTYRGNFIDGVSGFSLQGGTRDTINNTENVIVNGPAPGTWIVTVIPGPGNYGTGQGFGLVVTGDVSETSAGAGLPTADFSGSPPSGDAPLSVAFTSLATGTISNYYWSFGDGTFSTAQNPAHVYSSPGSYDVTLTVGGPGGAAQTVDVGYVTATAPAHSRPYYVSFSSTVDLPGVGLVQSSDVVRYDPATNVWSPYFDASLSGLPDEPNVSAVHARPDGSLILAFDAETITIPGLIGGPSGNVVERSDLVLYRFPTATLHRSAGLLSFIGLGEEKKVFGKYYFLFDGSDIGLDTPGEAIDGLDELPNGDLLLSLQGTFGIQIQDEDVMRLRQVQYGTTSSGSLSIYFDGSDAGFGDSDDEDLQALSFDPGKGDLLFSTVGPWSASGGTGAVEDIGRFSGLLYGATTFGDATVEYDFSALGLDPGENVDGLSFQP